MTMQHSFLVLSAVAVSAMAQSSAVPENGNPAPKPKTRKQATLEAARAAKVQRNGAPAQSPNGGSATKDAEKPKSPAVPQGEAVKTAGAKPPGEKPVAEKPAPKPAPAVVVPDDGRTEVPLDLFSVPEGLEVTLWASSPMLFNPTNIAFDDKGRLWVAEGVNYRGKDGRRPEGDRVVVLEDSNADGKADKSTVFVQEKDLDAPLGVAVFENKVVVSQPPNLLVYTDKNRNGRFDAKTDRREALLTGFGGRQHDHSLHSVTAGPDGFWYFNQGNTGAQFTDKSGRTFRMGSPYDDHRKGEKLFSSKEIAGQKSDDGHVWIGGFAARMKPDGTSLSIIGHNFRNSYEQAVTSLGDVFQSDNDDPPACRVSPVMEGGNAGFASADGQRAWRADQRPGQPTAVAEWRQEDPGTMPAGDVYGGGSPTGVAFYENGALGDQWRGLLLACEAGKNVVYGYLPRPDGAGWKLERFNFLTSNKEGKFSGSDFLGRGQKLTGEMETKFRPSDVAVGPDGALYVADWFDARVGGHGTLDDRYTGAIYRIAPKGFKSKVPRLDLSSTEGQVLALRSPAVNVRHSGFTRLQAQGAKAVPAVAKLLDDPDPYIAARAVWLLAQMGPKGVAKVEPLLEAKDENVRTVAFRALHRAGAALEPLALKMAGDASPAVRREVAISQRDVPVETSLPVLVQIGKAFDGKDRAYLEAFGMGCEGKEEAVYAALAKEMGGTPEAWSGAFDRITWRLHPASAVPALQQRLLSPGLDAAQRSLALTSLAFVPTREASVAMLEVAAKNPEAKEMALWWLLQRQGNDWKEFQVAEGLKASGVYDPDTIQLTAVEFPAIPEDAPKLPPTEEILKLDGDVARGQSAASVCLACHRIEQNGPDYGPNLTAFGAQQPREVIINAIVNPSADISHGYDGMELKTKDGLTIIGMAVSNGDPVVMNCVGGAVQRVPRNRIASLKPLGRSLMYEPSQLGLDAQKVADIVTYLKAIPAPK
jgi:putative membrane-bound dehydrogenase-like protein